MLKVVSSEKAWEIIESVFSNTDIGYDTVHLSECAGRVLYENIVASQSIPSFDRSTVDGYAVKASDTYGSGESIPSQLTVIGEILMGEQADICIDSGECVKISTGGMLPEGADSVVMVEHTDSAFDGFCLVFKAVSPFENVTKKGDDIKDNDIVFEKGRLISSRELGILSALGISELKVAKKVRAGIISTGDELVDIDSEASFGKIRDVNSYILSSLMKECGCECTRCGIIRDNYEEIKAAVKKACEENDVVLISGGSSAGARDMTADIISSMGQLYFHGIAMKPGKPTIFGKVNNKAVFGLPGHPTASYFVALRFVKPLVEMMMNYKPKNFRTCGRLVQNISSNHGREEIVCVKLDSNNVTPVYGKSGITFLLYQSDGYIIIDRNCEGLKSGDIVEVNLF